MAAIQMSPAAGGKGVGKRNNHVHTIMCTYNQLNIDKPYMFLTITLIEEILNETKIFKISNI